MRTNGPTPDSVPKSEVTLLFASRINVKNNAAEFQTEREWGLEYSRLVVLMDSMRIEKVNMIDGSMGDLDVDQRRVRCS